MLFILFHNILDNSQWQVLKSWHHNYKHYITAGEILKIKKLCYFANEKSHVSKYNNISLSFPFKL